MNPKISIIMAVKDTERYVGEAIRSILRQHFTDFELIVIDDGSTDGSKEIVACMALEDRRIIHLDNGRNL